VSKRGGIFSGAIMAEQGDQCSCPSAFIRLHDRQLRD
jgi:hypothetical protein